MRKDDGYLGYVVIPIMLTLTTASVDAELDLASTRMFQIML